MKIARALLVAALSLPLLVAAQADSQADTKRFAELKAKHDQHQPISDEDQQWAQRYMAAHRNQQGGAKKGGADHSAQWTDWAKAHPPRDFTGMTPLEDLGKGTYQGEQGGLYPGGENKIPAAHLKAGLALSKQIVPLDPDGHKSAGGKIVLLAIGMSNTTMEFEVFQKLAAREKGLNPCLVIVDGAQSGHTAERIADPARTNFWKVVDDRLEKAGVTGKQVQAVWYKEANAMPKEGFPGAAKKLQGGHVAVMHDLHDKFPNLKIAYMSDRTYGGYALTPLNPEPYAYETGFSVKWTIGDQIAGKPELNFDPAKGGVRSPWLAWGPRLWTDGVKGRKTDGFIFAKEDLRANDRTHPSEESGREKVAKLLMEFLKNDPTSKPWFVGKM